MDFNIKKCKRLHIGKHQYNEDYTMENNNGERCQIQNVTEEEDLGVIIDTNLKFDSHITAKINKANRNLGIINRSFTYMDKPMFLNLYKALVRPHLEYASPVWSPFLRKQQVAIENVQRRATKLLKNISQLSYKDRLLHLGLPSLEYRRNRADMLQVFKIVHNYDKISNTELLRLSKYSRTRGHNFKLQKQTVKSEIRKNSFSNRVIDTWNSLPYDVVNADSVNSFKSKLNRHWKTHPNKFEPQCYTSKTDYGSIQSNRWTSRSQRLTIGPVNVS